MKSNRTIKSTYAFLCSWTPLLKPFLHLNAPPFSHSPLLKFLHVVLSIICKKICKVQQGVQVNVLLIVPEYMSWTKHGLINQWEEQFCVCTTDVISVYPVREEAYRSWKIPPRLLRSFGPCARARNMATTKISPRRGRKIWEVLPKKFRLTSQTDNRGLNHGRTTNACVRIWREETRPDQTTK